jgi:hypothetical protein
MRLTYGGLKALEKLLKDVESAFDWSGGVYSASIPCPPASEAAKLKSVLKKLEHIEVGEQ